MNKCKITKLISALASIHSCIVLAFSEVVLQMEKSVEKQRLACWEGQMVAVWHIVIRRHRPFICQIHQLERVQRPVDMSQIQAFDPL